MSAPAPQNRIVLAEAAATVLLHRAGEKHEVLPPLEETSELIKDMIGELKLAASAAFPDCEELPSGKALLALEASRYLQDATGWPSVTGALTCLQLKVRGQAPTDIRDVVIPAFRQIAPPALPEPESSKPKINQAVGGGGGAWVMGKVTPETQAFLDKLAQSRATHLPRPPIPRVKPGRTPASHDERVGELLRAGWRHDDILAALNSTKDVRGDEDLDAAQDYLENLRQWRLQSANGPPAPKA